MYVSNGTFYWIIGGLFVLVGIVFAITKELDEKKADKVVLDEFKKEQCERNKEFNDMIKHDRDLLIRIDENVKIIKERSK